jgi:hypothetical protein
LKTLIIPFFSDLHSNTGICETLGAAQLCLKQKRGLMKEFADAVLGKD